jgi:hypothetical protein
MVTRYISGWPKRHFYNCKYVTGYCRCYRYCYRHHHTLPTRKHHLHCSLFQLKFCPSLLVPVDLRVPNRYLRDFSLLNVGSSCKNRPSAGCASGANVLCKNVDIFKTKMFLKSSVFWDISPCSQMRVNRCFSEMSVDFHRVAWHYIPKDRTLHNHRCENLKSYTVMPWYFLISYLLKL